MTTAATPTLTARAAGDASGTVAYTFQVWAVDHDTEPLASGTVSVAAGEAARWAPAADLLEPGGHYTFRVRASVGDISSDWSESLPFVVRDA